MCSTNALLSVVESHIGHLPVYRRGSQEWEAFRGVYARYQYRKYQRILSKIDKSAAVSFSSTTSMQTYLFWDAEYRLIDFEVDAQ